MDKEEDSDICTGSGISFVLSKNVFSTFLYKRQRFFLVISVFPTNTDACADTVGRTGDQVVQHRRLDIGPCPFQLCLQASEVGRWLLFVQVLLDNCPKFLDWI